MTEICLASWNIRAGLGRDMRRLPMRTLEVIAGLNADVVLLQEADFRMHPRPAALPTLHGRIGPLEVVDLTPTGVGLGWHGIAMLKRPDIRIEDIHRFDLPALEPRGAVVVDMIVNACRVRIVGVHLGLLRSNRRKQFAYIGDRLSELAPRPTILAGDFNEWRSERGLETMPDWLNTDSPGPTYPAGRPLLRLDRLAFSRDVELVHSAVIDRGPARIASDHRPVRARFRLFGQDAQSVLDETCDMS